MGRLARRALPLGLAALLTSLVINVPRLFVDKYLGSADLGVFAALTYVIVVGSVAVNAMAQSVGPRLARALAVGDARRYRRLLAAASAWCAAIGLAGVLAAAAGGAPLLTLLYGRTYAPYTGVLVIVMLAGLFTYVSAVFEIATTARRFLGAHALINVSRIVLTIGLCVTMIPTHGLIGAAWAIALAQGAAMLMYAVTACARMPRPVQPGL